MTGLHRLVLVRQAPNLEKAQSYRPFSRLALSEILNKATTYASKWLYPSGRSLPNKGFVVFPHFFSGMGIESLTPEVRNRLKEHTPVAIIDCDVLDIKEPELYEPNIVAVNCFNSPHKTAYLKNYKHCRNSLNCVTIPTEREDLLLLCLIKDHISTAIESTAIEAVINAYPK